jgi:hypothetical protein
MKEGRVFIEITETRAISSSEDCWKAMRRAKTVDKATGKATGGYGGWTSYKYFNDYEGVVRYFEGELTRQCGATTFPELRRSAEKIHQMLMEIHQTAKPRV